MFVLHKWNVLNRTSLLHKQMHLILKFVDKQLKLNLKKQILKLNNLIKNTNTIDSSIVILYLDIIF